MTTNGKTCLRRAILECERRFFNNTTEELFDEDDIDASKRIKLSDREKWKLLLDLRTCLVCFLFLFIY